MALNSMRQTTCCHVQQNLCWTRSRTSLPFGVQIGSACTSPHSNG